MNEMREGKADGREPWKAVLDGKGWRRVGPFNNREAVRKG